MPIIYGIVIDAFLYNKMFDYYLEAEIMFSQLMHIYHYVNIFFNCQLKKLNELNISHLIL